MQKLEIESKQKELMNFCINLANTFLRYLLITNGEEDISLDSTRNQQLKNFCFHIVLKSKIEGPPIATDDLIDKDWTKLASEYPFNIPMNNLETFQKYLFDIMIMLSYTLFGAI